MNDEYNFDIDVSVEENGNIVIENDTETLESVEHQETIICNKFDYESESNSFVMNTVYTDEAAEINYYMIKSFYRFINLNKS